MNSINSNTSAIKKSPPEELPLIPLRDLVLFPEFTISLFIGRAQSKNAVTASMKQSRRIFLCTQKDPGIANPTSEDIHKTGVIAEIIQMLKLPDGTLKILVEIIRRANWRSLKNQDIDNQSKQADNFFQIVQVKEFDTSKEEVGMSALTRRLVQQYIKFTRNEPNISSESIKKISQIEDPRKITDLIAGRLTLATPQKQEILAEVQLNKRMEKVINSMLTLISLQNIDKKIQKNVQERILKTQKDYYLGEKVKEIRKELGHDKDIYQEAEELKSRAEEIGLPVEVREKVLKEISRLEKIPPLSGEITVLRNYIDWILDVPWTSESTDNTNVEHAKEVLDQDHFGLEEVKDRILDFIVLRRFVKKVKGPILCFVGPPGVGKTSLGRSIANALERQFIRISLGGTKDEAEIYGHRKTYIGAMPGKIIQSMKKSKTINPVFLLDEVDKLASDFRGDPASALLEVLDPEQNSSFQDHYLEVNYDLSNVLFIATANALHKIPHALRDRMEIIHIGGYSELEKLQIGKKFLLPKALNENGLKANQIKLSNSHLYFIIRHYTKEAGVRNLERALHKIARKVLRKLAEEKEKSESKKAKGNNKKISLNYSIQNEKFGFNRKYLKDFLGKEQYQFGFVGKDGEQKNEIGYCNGLAWTEMGGDLLGVEAVLTSGRGRLQITGNLGEVMQESVKAAFTLIKSMKDLLALEDVIFRKQDVHVHVPEGAIPKDGPSAGITVAMALVSAFTQIPVKGNIAMTGEVTLRGLILPVGGIKEKVLAAHRGQIREIILPAENKKDMVDLPAYIKKRIKFHFVSYMKEAISLALIRDDFQSISGLNSIVAINQSQPKDIQRNIIQ